MPRQIIIDTDPGLDDAVAILLALASPEELEVLGIVAVAGNLPLAVTERNARRVLELAGHRDVPVFAGCARPMFRPLATKEGLHGETERDRLSLPEPAMALAAQHGVDFLVDTLRAAEPGAITVCALGPLTNIAMALVKAPDMAGKIGELVLMGGAVKELGNVTPTAEFNIHADPHAAACLRQRRPDHDDAARRHLSGAQHAAARAALRGIGNRCGPVVAGLLQLYGRRRSERFGLGRAVARPLRDRPSAAAGIVRAAAWSMSRSRPRAR